jgi:hypothetical protein
MKTSITLAFSGIVLITSVIAQTSAAVAQTQENAPSERRGPLPARPLSRPSLAATECAPDDRKCEVERKLGLVNDILSPLPPPRSFDPRKGRGF